MKILNLDTYAEVKRQITLDGKSHSIVETTVQEFCNNLVAAEIIEKADLQGVEATKRGVDLSIASILQSIPTLDEERVRRLNLVQMSVVLKFIRGDLDPDVVQPVAPGSEGEEAKKD